MRQQYHIRLVGQEYHIWDVKCLIRLSHEFPVQNISLTDIKELNEKYWFSGADDPEPTVKNVSEHTKLILECDLQHPIILCASGRVLDGMHRVAKAFVSGHTTIKAVQFQQDPAPHYINVSLKDLPYNDEPLHNT